MTTRELDDYRRGIGEEVIKVKDKRNYDKGHSRKAPRTYRGSASTQPIRAKYVALLTIFAALSMINTTSAQRSTTTGVARRNSPKRTDSAMPVIHTGKKRERTRRKTRVGSKTVAEGKTRTKAKTNPISKKDLFAGLSFDETHNLAQSKEYETTQRLSTGKTRNISYLVKPYSGKIALLHEKILRKLGFNKLLKPIESFETTVTINSRVFKVDAQAREKFQGDVYPLEIFIKDLKLADPTFASYSLEKQKELALGVLEYEVLGQDKYKLPFLKAWILGVGDLTNKSNFRITPSLDIMFVDVDGLSLPSIPGPSPHNQVFSRQNEVGYQEYRQLYLYTKTDEYKELRDAKLDLLEKSSKGRFRDIYIQTKERFTKIERMLEQKFSQKKGSIEDLEELYDDFRELDILQPKIYGNIRVTGRRIEAYLPQKNKNGKFKAKFVEISAEDLEGYPLFAGRRSPNPEVEAYDASQAETQEQGVHSEL